MKYWSGFCSVVSLALLICVPPSLAEGASSNAITDAWVPWGESACVSNEDILFSPWPDWMASAFKVGGAWDTNLPAWVVEAEATNEASLNIEVDRLILTNPALMRLDYVDHSNATLMLDLYEFSGTNDPNEPVFTSNLVGNLMSGGGGVTSRTFTIPFGLYTNATGIRLRRDTGAMTIFDTLLSSDRDGDGYADSEEQQWGSDPVSALSVPCAAIMGEVFYAGVQTGVVHVLATTNAEEWVSSHYLTLGAPGAYTLTGLTLRKAWYPRAYRDVNGNGNPDDWEPHGGYVASNGAQFLDLMGNTGGVNITMTDPDTDGDGMSDVAERALGLDPYTSNAFTRLPFTERFEADTVALGDVNGQNGWLAYPSNSVLVQTGEVWEGSQAMAVRAAVTPATVCQLFAVTNAPVVWVDAYVQAWEGEAPSNATWESVIMCFGKKGYLMVYDGLNASSNKWVTLTNVPPCGTTGAWVRLTTKMDYGAQRWMVCLNGFLATQGLGFATPVSQFAKVSSVGKRGGMDALTVSTNEPAGLSLDGDLMPDDWERTNFGNLVHADGGDADGDGLYNLEEFRHGADPTVADTDGDGMSDGWEVAQGFSPTNAADAVGDADADGVSNVSESEHHTDPRMADSDGDGLSDGVELKLGLDPRDPQNTNGVSVAHFLVNRAWTNAPANSDPDGAGPALAMGWDAFASIQAALDHAGEGALLTVAPGVYPERLVISRSVTVAGSVVSDPAQGTLPQAVIRPAGVSAAGALVEIGSPDDSGTLAPRVVLRDLSLDGSVAYLAQPNPYIGFNLHRGSQVLLFRCHQAYVRTPVIGVQTGWGVVTYHAGLDIEDCYFEEFSKAALSAFGSGTVNVRRSKFRGVDMTTVYQFNQAVLVYQDSVGGAIDDNIFLDVGPGGKFNANFGGANVAQSGAVGTCLQLKSDSGALSAHSNLFINCQGLSRDDRGLARIPALTAERFFAQGNRTDNGRWVCLGPYGEATSIYGCRTDDPNMPNYAVRALNGALFSRNVVTLCGGHTYEPDWPMPNPAMPLTLEAVDGVARVVLPNSELPYHVIVGTNVEVVLQPRVSLAMPVAHASFVAGAPITVEAAVFGTQAWTSVSLYADQALLAAFTNAPFAFVWTNAPEGPHNLRAVLTDAQGREVASPSVPISVGAPASVFWECWKGVNGTSVDALFANARYPGLPDERAYLGSFEGPRDWALEYGARYRAILTAPQSGAYTFSFMADDSAIVWLGTNESPSTARQILSGGPGAYGVWSGNATVQLVAGGRYYIEALHKQCIGSSHFAVGWRLPDGTYERPIPGTRLEPYITAETTILQLKARNLYTPAANAPDTDGDGLCDDEETTVTLTDPLVPNSMVAVQVIDGPSTVARLGDWTTNTAAVIARSHAGTLDYTLDIPAQGQYRVAVEYAEGYLNPYNYTLDLTFSVDGEYVGRGLIPVTPGQYQTTAVYTPWLAPGAHTLRIRWWNVYPRKALQVRRLVVSRIAGPDADANNHPDWTDSRMKAVCSADVLPAASLVSPVCIEGLGAYRSMMTLMADGVTNAVLPGTDQRWYANVPLNPAAPTAVAVSFQNGGYTLTQAVDWLRVNVRDGQALTLRRGDALRLSAFGDGVPTGAVVSLSIGTNNLETISDSAAVFQFDEPGSFAVRAIAAGTTNLMNVTVVAATQPKGPDIWLKQTRSWTWRGLPAQAVVEAGSLRLMAGAVSGTNRSYQITALDEDEPGSLVARLGAGGPILAHVEPLIFTLYSGVLGYVPVVAVFPDGSTTIENTLYLSRIPSDLEILLTINTGGAIFGNGTLEYTLSRDDFDPLGGLSYRVLRPAGKTTTCHNIVIRQDGVVIGPTL